MKKSWIKFEVQAYWDFPVAGDVDALTYEDGTILSFGRTMLCRDGDVLATFWTEYWPCSKVEEAFVAVRTPEGKPVLFQLSNGRVDGRLPWEDLLAQLTEDLPPR